MSQKCVDVWYTFTRSCAWIGNSNPYIMHDSMLLTILSMSDCHGICPLIIESSVSVGMNAWGVCVYSISSGLMVLMACISKSGCFSDSCCKAVCAGVNGYDLVGKREHFSIIRLDLYFCLFPLTMESNLATVNLSDFSHSTVTLSSKSLEIISSLEFLFICLGYVVCVFAAGF